MSYIPERGDLVWLDFNPQAGHEQVERRPALVLSPTKYNRRVGLALVCPITNKAKGYVFEVALPDDLAITGVVLSDQIKSIDCSSRNIEFAGKSSHEVIEQALLKASKLLE